MGRAPPPQLADLYRAWPRRPSQTSKTDIVCQVIALADLTPTRHLADNPQKTGYELETARARVASIHRPPDHEASPRQCPGVSACVTRRQRTSRAPRRLNRARQVVERLAAGDRWCSPANWAHSPDGQNITHRFRRLLRKAGLPPKRFHDLRQACASLLLVQGVHPRVVMETLGHSQISLTMNAYSHVLPALQHEAAEKWRQFWRPHA